MFLTELFNEMPDGYVDGAKDPDKSSPTVKDLRKTKITLAQLSRLRILNDIRTVEKEQKIQTLQKQYLPAPDTSGMGM